MIFNDGKHYWLGEIRDKVRDSVTIWYYRALKEDRPYKSLFKPVWVETSGKEEWRKIPKKRNSVRCEGVKNHRQDERRNHHMVLSGNKRGETIQEHIQTSVGGNIWKRRVERNPKEFGRCEMRGGDTQRQNREQTF